MTLEERLEGLENEVAYLRAELAQSVQTRCLEIVDAAGVVRVRLEATETGRADVAVYDDKGKVAVGLSTSTNGTGLLVFDAAGKLRASLGMDAEGPQFTLYDEAGTPRAIVNVAEGEPAIILTDAAGRPISSTPVPQYLPVGAWRPGAKPN